MRARNSRRRVKNKLRTSSFFLLSPFLFSHFPVLWICSQPTTSQHTLNAIPMTFGSTLFETNAALQTVDQPNLTQSRLDSAYKSLHSHVPGCENLRRTTKILRKHGLEVSSTSTIQQLLTTDRQFFLKTVPPIPAKGLLRLVAIASLYDLKIYYFSTRKSAQIVHPTGRRTVAILHHIDSFLGDIPQWFELKDMDQYQEVSIIYVEWCHCKY